MTVKSESVKAPFIEGRKLVSWSEVFERIKKLGISSHKKVYGVPGPGAVIAGLMGSPVDFPHEAEYIVDGVQASGKTREKFQKDFPEVPFLVLWRKEEEFQGSPWLAFPWEGLETSSEDQAKALIKSFGVADPDISKRYVKALNEYISPSFVPQLLTEEFRVDPCRSDLEDSELINIYSHIPVHFISDLDFFPKWGKVSLGFIPWTKTVKASEEIQNAIWTICRKVTSPESLCREIGDFFVENITPYWLIVKLEYEVSVDFVRSTSDTVYTYGSNRTREASLKDQFYKILSYGNQ